MRSFVSPDDGYALGLWCADGYWWSSSIGLTNVEPQLIIWFGRYLGQVLGVDRLKLRLYNVSGRTPDDRVLALTDQVSERPACKMKRTAYQIYVNSRPLLRAFFGQRDRLHELPPPLLGPYFAGRFDGDGTLGSTPRIAYTTRAEADVDSVLLARLGITTSVLRYTKANEFCIYIHKASLAAFVALITSYSWKVAIGSRRSAAR